VLSLPPLLRQPGFRLFWLGVAFTQIGSRATAAANLWQIQDLTDSIFAVGVVSLVEGVAVIGIAPLGGTIADRMDRKRLLQIAQGAALLSSIVLAITTFTNTITPLWIYAATAVVSGAATFDTPARQALIPALVPRDRLIDAYALIQPLGNLARLVGPAIAGLLIAGWGVGAVYVFDVVTYAGLIASLAFVAFGRYELGPPQHWWHSVLEGLRYVRGKPLIWQLMALDLAAVFFAAYRVVLPALARDVFVVGAQGYGFLAAVPALGGIVGAAIVYRLRRMPRKGLLVLLATMAYAIAAIGLGYAPTFALALVLAGALGLFDAITTTIRQAVVQLETPDRLRGRVTSLYQMSARGGPALGQAQLGALATALGAPLALAVGGALTLGYAAWLALTGTTVRDYEA